MRQVGSALSVITDRQEIRRLGDEGELQGSLSVANAYITYLIDRDAQLAAKTDSDNVMHGDNVFENLPVYTGSSAPAGDNFVTFGQVSSYLASTLPLNAVAYSPDLAYDIKMGPYTNAKGNNWKKIPESFSYTATRDCELHLWLESYATKKVQPSSMSINVTDKDGARRLVYIFPDNDQEAFVSYYWAHAVKAGTEITLRHVNKEGNGWYFRQVTEIY